ncbi:MAG: flagellar basal body-associated FliL family protein [Bradyrhizobiaceae bacterium]|nr:flagellar basal body-associated FliL family protein [Bradyrhizobiaceae bacterium]
MASKVTTAPTDLEEEEASPAEKPAAGGSFFGRLIGRFKGMSRMQMMIFGGVVLLVAAAGAGAFMFLGGEEKKEAVAPKAIYHELPEIMVNLAAGNDRPQYLRVRITLEVDDSHVIEALRPVMPRVVDTFQVHLRELRASDLDGSAGLFRLREELTRRVNHAIAPAKIRAVLFREVVVQ